MRLFLPNMLRTRLLRASSISRRIVFWGSVVILAGCLSGVPLWVSWHRWFVYDQGWCPIVPTQDSSDDHHDVVAASRSQPQIFNASDACVMELRVEPVRPGSIHITITYVSRSLELKPREVCAIESAARLHPNETVTVSVDSRYLAKNLFLSKLLNAHANINFVRFDLYKSIEGTLLSEWYRNSGLDALPVSYGWHSDLFRIATLYKYGGWYLDTDEIVLKPFTHIRNALPTETHHVSHESCPNGNFLAFDKGHPFLKDIMMHLTTKNVASMARLSRHDQWIAFGPIAIRAVIRDKGWCSLGNGPQTTCRDGLALLPISAFAPVTPASTGETLWSTRAQTGRAFDSAVRNAYAVHMFNSLYKHSRILLNVDSVVGELFKKTCPVTSEMAGDEL